MSTSVPVASWDEGKYKFQRKLGDFVQYFQVNLPVNSQGIPLQLIHPIGIATGILDCETTDDVPTPVVEDAILEVDFTDGMPVIDGLPLWERLDGEHVEYYNLFKEYREDLYNRGKRSIAQLAGNRNFLGRDLNVLAKAYHWQLRCRAYDLYKRMEHERRRYFEIQKVETKHAAAAQKMLEQGLTYLDAHPEQLSPKIALQMVQLAIKTERLALGLNPEKPGSGDDSNGTRVTINQTAGNVDAMSTSVDVGTGKKAESAEDLSYLESVLSILDRTGALQKKDTVVEGDFEVVDETPA